MSKKVGTGLMPLLSTLPGFGGYFLIEASNGTMTSIGFFDTASQADWECLVRIFHPLTSSLRANLSQTRTEILGYVLRGCA